MKARLPQGYQNKGMGNMNNMVRQAQKMQEDIQAVQEKLEQTEFSETAGGGMVELTMTGGRVLKSIKINPEIVDKDDIESLQDVIVAGVNAIITKIDDTEVTCSDELISAKNEYAPGDTVKLTVYRSGQTMEVKLTLEESTPEKTALQDEAQTEYQQQYQQQQQQQQSGGWPFSGFRY